MKAKNKNEKGYTKDGRWKENYTVHTKKEGREEKSREARKELEDSMFWTLLPLCPTYEHINKKSWVYPP